MKLTNVPNKYKICLFLYTYNQEQIKYLSYLLFI